MILCKHNSARRVPISYNLDEKFQRRNQEYFFICQIISGFAIAIIDGEKINIMPDMLLCYPQNTSIEIVTSYHLKARSLSFAPEFINRRLNWSIIESPDYSILRQKINLPCFDMFYKRNLLYNGIMPMIPSLSKMVSRIFDEIIIQLETQPDVYWSCRVRLKIFSFFKIVEYFWKDLMQGGQQSEELEVQVMDYINLNFCESIEIINLCNLFHTNRTTLSNKFKSYTGFSIIEYVTNKRMHLACSVLATTALSVKEISAKCGYSDAAYFTKVFVKRIGMTPTQYRKHQRNLRDQQFTN